MAAPERGAFITIEGTEGVGKSTNIAFIKESLRAAGVDAVVTREPGGTPLAEQIRELLLANRDEVVDSTAELLLMFAARAQHLNTVIEPALAAGRWVVCDRFTDATFAYQGGGRGLDQQVIESLETLVQQGRQPDLTLYLDIDVKEGLQRAGSRGEFDRFEKEDIVFFERVRKAYQERIAQQPNRFVTIDAGQELPKVQEDIRQALLRFLPEAQ